MNKREIWLIQRGKFKTTALNAITGIDSIIQWDYMGSAEFEFGALPESLKRIVKDCNNNKNTWHPVTIRNQNFTLLAKPEDIETIVPALNLLANKETKNQCYLKEYAGLDIYFDKEDDIFMIPNFWWDVDNDWMLFPADKEEMVLTAMCALTERGFGL
jgi:hypothetical protein